MHTRSFRLRGFRGAALCLSLILASFLGMAPGSRVGAVEDPAVVG